MKIASCCIIMFSIFVISTAFTSQDISESIKRGKEVYELSCQNCHMEDGKGVTGNNPPLDKTDFLQKPAATLIGIVLNGQTGEVVVNAEKYDGTMPAMEYLDDEQIADVLNYVRNSWGNKIPKAITPAMVADARKKYR